MFIITAKLPRRKLALGVAAAALVCCGALSLNLPPARSLPAAALSALPEGQGVRSNEDRVAYLTACGWAVDPQPAAVQEMQIPQVFDDRYADYLALQRSQGFDLEQHAGERAKRYTYSISNHPQGAAQANLLIWKNQVIAGEVLSPQPGGFLQGLQAE